ncbi:MAG: hypothetical protein Q9169_001854 [Polycauliona sp. 2 TL-2023]
MTREATLLAKHDDLKSCLDKRKSLLLELYRSTAVLAKIRNRSPHVLIQPDHDTSGEQSFLDANNLAIGRLFHPSTLPPLSPKSQHNSHSQQSRYASAVDSAAKRPGSSIAGVEKSHIPTSPTVDTNAVVSSTTLNRSASPVLHGTATDFPSIVEHGASSTSKGKDERDAATISKAAYATESANVAVRDRVATVKPLADLPTTTDDAEELSEPLVKQHVAEKKSSGAYVVHLPPTEQHEQRSKDLDSHEASGSSVPADFHMSGETSQWHHDRRLSAPHQDDSDLPTTISPLRDHAVDRGVSGSQMDTARSDAAVGHLPFTSGEQRRLEEAQFLQESMTAPRPAPPPAEAVQPDSASEQTKDNSIVIPQVPEMEFRPMDSLRREQQQFDATSEISALRNYTHPGEVAKNITLSQRPPMRIDTGSLQSVDSLLPRVKKPVESGIGVSHTPPDSATSVKAIQTPSQAQSPPERMTTRVSSGALRHKPVSEILGETRKPASPQTDRAAQEQLLRDANRDTLGVQSPSTLISTATPDPAAFRLRLGELKAQDKSKLSTVIFARKQPLQSAWHSDSLNPQGAEVPEAKSKNQEYFLPLFSAQSATPPQSQLLNRLIGSASKTLTTANHYMDFHEQQDCRILTKIQHLQSSNRWSFRQLERTVEPDRPLVHWDVLLGQMKWLRTDFREERKWKIAAAHSMARSCAQWVEASKEERAALQVRVRPAPSVTAAPPDSAPTPELVHSAGDDSSDAADDEVYNAGVFPANAPAAIFSMTPDMFIFGLTKSPITEKLLQELPLYQPSIDTQQALFHQSHSKADREWKAPLLPVSKLIEGKLASHDRGPPRKRSRYHYTDLDEDNSLSSLAGPDLQNSVPSTRPAQDDVALFNPDNKHIRDRIHAGHAFRPPSDHPMPSQSFFEARQSSQWTQGEDDELRRLVREYAYNWSLVSSCLSMPSAFSAGTERRTPWECFERWIGLEGLPAEMAKTHYFRAYHGRLQAAQTTHEAQQQAVQQQQGNNAPHLPLRRRSTQPFTVERRKNTKHVHLVNAIRNLARKREATAKKQEEGKKATQSVQPRHTMHTPQEFSRLRHERDLKMQEQAKAYRLQVMQQQQKTHAAQRAAMQISQHPNGTSVMPNGRSSLQASANGIGPAGLPVNGQVQANLGGQPRAAPMPRPSNGAQSNSAFHNQPGIPHAPMQSTAGPASARLPPPMGSESMRVFQEANRVQAEQQRFLLQQRQQQQQHSHMNGHTSPIVSNSNFMSSGGPSGHGAFQGRSASPSMNGQGTTNGASSPPRMTNPSQPQALSSGMMPTINQIMSQLQARNPHLTQEQIGQMATERLKQYTSHNHAQAAMQAAAGTGGSSSSNIMNGAGMSNNALNSSLMGQLPAIPHQPPATAVMNGSPAVSAQQQYAHMIRNQQQHQQNRGSGTPFSGPRPSSRSGTPQIHRTPSAQGGHPSPSPVPSQAQVVGGQ